MPAILALWFAQRLVEIVFPDVTLIDPGALNTMALISGLAARAS